MPLVTNATFFVALSFFICLVPCFSEDIEISKKKDLGCDSPSVPDDTLSIQYSYRLSTSWEILYSSYGGVPQIFKLGAGREMKGLDQGLVGMCEGSTWVLTVPPELGFGDEGKPPHIPPGATLIIRVELKQILKPCNAKGLTLMQWLRCV